MSQVQTIEEERPAMDMYRAAMIADGAEDPVDEEDAIAAWQYLIDTGVAWQLQGRIGRQAAYLIEEGICHVAGS